MDFRFGAGVSRRDGDKIGTLRGLIYDPTTQQISAVVIDRTPMVERDVLAAIGTVDSADIDQTYVELTPEQVDALPDFMTERNLAPPPDPSPDTGDEITDPVDVPDVPPVGAATGIESIAFTPIIQETFNIPGRDVVLDGNAELWATDGHIGNLKEVRVDDQTKRVAFVVAAEGLIFSHDVVAYGNQIDEIEPGRVVLNVGRQALEDQSRE